MKKSGRPVASGQRLPRPEHAEASSAADHRAAGGAAGAEGERGGASGGQAARGHEWVADLAAELLLARRVEEPRELRGVCVLKCRSLARSCATYVQQWPSGGDRRTCGLTRSPRHAALKLASSACRRRQLSAGDHPGWPRAPVVQRVTL